MKKTILAILLLAIFAFNLARLVKVEAQGAAPFSFSVSAPHLNCPAVVVGVSQYCFATDGIWQSLNGAAWTQVGVPTLTGVTSWNGQTGAITYVPPSSGVSSVNGKTGAVVLSLQ